MSELTSLSSLPAGSPAGSPAGPPPAEPSAGPPPAGRALGGPIVVLGVLGLLLSLTIGAVVLPTLAVGRGAPALPIHGTMPAFQLRDQDGHEVTEDALRGHVVVANFIFTRCPTVCPVFTMKMRRVQDRTTDAAEGLKLLSFSVDPEHDTPAVLAEYAKAHGADPWRWRFVTGQSPDQGSDQIRRIAEGLMLAMDTQGAFPDGVPNIIHGEHFVLIDHELRVRGYYDSNDAKRIERMLRDARQLLRAASQANRQES